MLRIIFEAMRTTSVPLHLYAKGRVVWPDAGPSYFVLRQSSRVSTGTNVGFLFKGTMHSLDCSSAAAVTFLACAAY